MPDLSVAAWLAFAVLFVIVVLNSLVLLGIVRAVYALQQVAGDRLTDVESDFAGRPAPPFEALDISGRTIKSGSLARHRWAILFVSPSCRSCSATLSEMSAILSKADGRIVVVSRAPIEETKALATTYGLDVPFISDERDVIGALYRIRSVPTAVLIDAGNLIRSYGEPTRGDLESVADAVSA
jgi:peroxiredoxin